MPYIRFLLLQNLLSQSLWLEPYVAGYFSDRGRLGGEQYSCSDL